jgi:hypothetical protein
VKVVHRAHPDVVVTQGNHDALGATLPLVREWLPFEILHFPIRTAAQAARKFRVAQAGGLQSRGTSVPQHTDAAVRAMDAHGDESFFARLVVGDAALDGLLRQQELTRDTRLRDALRVALAGARMPPSTPPTIADDVSLATEAQAMLEHDSWVKLARRADRLERAVARLERERVPRLLRR